MNVIVTRSVRDGWMDGYFVLFLIVLFKDPQNDCLVTCMLESLFSTSSHWSKWFFLIDIILPTVDSWFHVVYSAQSVGSWEIG